MPQLTVQRPDSRFLRIMCTKCKNEQVIFNRASARVKCLVCGAELAEPTGGLAHVKGRVLQVLE